MLMLLLLLLSLLLSLLLVYNSDAVRWCRH
jgi:hypothetical protein